MAKGGKRKDVGRPASDGTLKAQEQRQPLDMPVCKAMGIRAFWVNRRGEAAEPQWLPFTEVKDVVEAARLIAG